MVRAAALKAREALSATIREELLAGGKARAPLGPPKPYDPNAGVKRKRCGECAGCYATNCGKCDNCKDMPCFGGKGTKRQSCRNRLCHMIAEEDAKAREEKDKEREHRNEERAKEREAKERERVARGEARLARRLAHAPTASRSGSRSTSSRNVRELNSLIGRAATARLPAVRLDPQDVSAGWGLQNVGVGTKVEARDIEKDDNGNDNGACYSGTVVARRRPEADSDDDDDDEYEYEYDDEEWGRKKARQEVQLSVEFDELLEPDDDAAGGAAGSSSGDRKKPAAAAAAAAAGDDEGEGGGEGEGEGEGEEEEDMPRLREWVMASNVRLRPPDAFPPGMIELVKVGDMLELWFDDGWWEVQVKSIISVAAAREARRSRGASSAAAWRASFGEKPLSRKDRQAADDAEEELERFTVESVLYKDSTHTVGPSRLRPRWLWSAAAKAWRFELLSGHGCVPSEADKPGGKPTFVFAHGVMRSMNSL